MTRLVKPTVSVMLTTVCTLKCKHCQIKIPYMKPRHIDKKQLLDSFREMFRIIDWVGDLALMGGELFLHPSVDEILLNAFEYKEQFERIVCVTNGTVVPQESSLEILGKHPTQHIIRIDDYGKLSNKINEITNLLRRMSISYEVRPYSDSECYGENGGGWVDVTGDFEYKGYSKDELHRVFSVCHNRETCVFLWEGKLYSCGMHAAGVLLEKVFDRENIDSIELLSDEPLSQKREVVSKFGTIPPNACSYCNGFDRKNSPRIRPAEQM